MSYAADLALGLALADDADVITLDRFGAADLVVESKPDLTPVSDADRAVEEAIRARLAIERPDDAISGEEFGTTGTAPRRWVIDPIDGTKNFVRGVPVWATLIALLDDGDPVVGVVSAPALGRRWWAALGDGAWAHRARRRAAPARGVARGHARATPACRTRRLSGWTAIGRRDAFLDTDGHVLANPRLR